MRQREPADPVRMELYQHVYNVNIDMAYDEFCLCVAIVGKRNMDL